MKLYEYQGKIIFSRYGIRTPSGFVPPLCAGRWSEESLVKIKFPVMVKAQVLAGGRGKAGGVVCAADQARAGRGCSVSCC